MRALQIWTLAARPKTLVAGIAPACTGAVLAMTEGHFSSLLFLLTLLTGILIQIGSNLTNDYFDCVKGADTAARKGFLRVMQAGLVPPSAMRRAILLTFTLVVISGAYLVFVGGFGIGLMLSLYLLLSLLYTAGPYPLAYLGLGDLLVLLLYGPGAVLITYFLQTHSLSQTATLAGLSLGTLSTTILAINNLRDVEEDRAAGKKTLIVRLGTRFGKLEIVALLALTFVIPLCLYKQHPFALLSLGALPLAISLAYAVINNEDPYQLNPLFEKAAKLLWLFTLLLCLGLML
jgi:1,4-dihydroxy-2-naphthoate octaprenyltransferase